MHEWSPEEIAAIQSPLDEAGICVSPLGEALVGVDGNETIWFRITKNDGLWHLYIPALALAPFDTLEELIMVLGVLAEIRPRRTSNTIVYDLENS